LTRGMARKQNNDNTTTNTPTTTREPEFGDQPSDRASDPLESRRPALEHALNALHGGGASRARAPAEDPASSVIVIPEDDETDTSDDDPPPFRTGAGPLPTPERPRRYSAPETPRPSAYYTPSRPPQPAPTCTELLARKREQTLLNKSPVRTSGVTAGRRTAKVPAGPRTVLGTPIPVAPAPATAAPPPQAVTAEVAQRPPTASVVTRNTVALYEEVQRVADGLEQLIRKHVARFPSEASRLSQHMASAFATFINPQPTAPTPDQTTTRAPDSRARSYAAAATAGARRPPPTRLRPTPVPMTRPTTEANPPHGRSAAGHTRIFARLPDNHPLRKADPMVIREKANGTPGLTNLFISAYQVPSGLALVTADPEAAATVLSLKASLQITLRATAVEAAEHWDAYLLTGVPRIVQSLAGPVVVGPEAVVEEIATVTGVKPRQVRWTKRTTAELPPIPAQGEMVLHLPQGTPPLPARLRLFGRLAAIRPLRPRGHQTKPCKRCHQYHDPHNCGRTPRCENCSQTEHETTGPCPWPTRCGNCRGPHPATDPTCPARPHRVNGVVRRPDLQQLRAIRSAGSRAWASANPTATSSNTATGAASPTSSYPGSRPDLNPLPPSHE
jgi:hypothetical protein